VKNYFIQYLKSVFIILSVFGFCACKNEVQEKIAGKWYAAQLIECDEIIPIERENVNLELSEKGKYIFNSTLNIHEEGDYNLKDSLLYTKDLLKADATVKVVRIAKLNKDTLELAMNYKGKEQILTLLREEPIAQGQMKTIKQSSDSSANNPPKDTANNNATVAAAATAAVAATALTATASGNSAPTAAKKETEKKESSKKEQKKSKKEIEREKKEKEEEKKEREKERKKREKARKEREKKEKEREKKEKEREKKERERAKKKKKK
jgi:hypothetical protein